MPGQPNHPVSVVKAHHEGGGRPHDDPGVAGTKGYSIWIGPTRYTMLRPPWLDFSTLNLNGVVCGVCFSGQREDGEPGDPSWPVTDAEIKVLTLAMAEARSIGWVVDHPSVSPHDNLNGSATVCPGTQVYDRWDDVVGACQKVTPMMEVDMLSYPYPRPSDLNKFSGATVVSGVGGRVQLHGNAKIDQPTVSGFWGPPNPTGIMTSFSEANGLCVVTMDEDEYHLHWKF